MSFTNIIFYPFFIGVILLLWIFRKRDTLRKLVLILASYVFLSLFDIRFSMCLLLVTVVNYLAAYCMRRNRERIAIYRTLGILFDILFLAVFKYFNFFAASVCRIVDTDFVPWDIILPVGISFYIFSAIGYLCDEAETVDEEGAGFLDFALYLCFFPKLISGPIVPWEDFKKQCHTWRYASAYDISTGVQIFVFGLFKKKVLADHMGVFVDQVFSAPKAFGSATLVFTAVSYSIQIYFDFSGYSDMAIGVARCVGFKLPTNFNLPFYSTTIASYWNRWHITLYKWLNEYIYNPLAFSLRRYLGKLDKEKRKKLKDVPAVITVIVTFLISGIWHGAGWNFVVFGLCHGITYIIQDFYGNWKKNRKWKIWGSGAYKVIAILLNFCTITVYNIIFRANSIGAAMAYLTRIVSGENGIEMVYFWSLLGIVMLLVGMIYSFYKSKKAGDAELVAYYPIVRLDSVAGWFWLFLVIGLIVSMMYTGESYFIYGKF